MKMTEFVSEVKTIPFNEDRIFNMLSDLSNLGKVQDRIPQDKIQDLFRVYKENNSQEYQIEDNTLIDEVNNLKLTDKNKKEINKKINLINDSIKELEEYRKKMETIIAK